ncbi:MAG: glycosyltransferase family 1 protein, partial [Isosphaeraceae bacterium]|nr:glycosyltransferase family 1 protein [Isosphaeraceae bacterium]
STHEPSWDLPSELASDLVIYWPTAYHWSPTVEWLNHIFISISKLVGVERAVIDQGPYEGTVIAQFFYQGHSYRVAIDFSDYMDHICQEALEGATCYFKMQYRRDGYGDDRIVPGGYPVSSPYFYQFLSKLRQDCDQKAKLYDVYGRFGLRFSAEIRRKAIALLSAAPDLNFVGGTEFVRNSRFLRDMARTKIGIDLPGNGDFCFRLIDYLAIGVCVIRPRPRTELPIPLIPNEHIIYCHEDLSDLVPLCRRYLADDAERERIARNARNYFDRYLHREQLARYYLHQFARALSRRAGGWPMPLGHRV